MKIDCRLVALPVVTAVDIVDECFQLGSVFRFFTKVDNINGDIVLLHLLCKFDQGLFISLNRATDKCNDSLSLVFVLSMLESQLYRGLLNAKFSIYIISFKQNMESTRTCAI